MRPRALRHAIRTNTNTARTSAFLSLRSLARSGPQSHVCVLQSALEALTLSPLPPIVIADGVSSCNGQEVPLALDRLRARGVDIASSESVLFQLMGDAASPQFKAFSKLIKEEMSVTKNTLRVLYGDVAGAKL
jgi:hypothetical protein